MSLQRKRKIRKYLSRSIQAFQIKLRRRDKILKGKTQDLTEQPDSEISDGGYSDYSDKNLQRKI